jgi:hypothetical protein
MIKHLLHIILISMLISACDTVEPVKEVIINEEEVIKTVQTCMDEQMECWNNGDIHCFMKHYWQSDSLLFIGKNGITKGWQPTLDNYLDGYQDKAAMGTLTFNNKIIRLLDNETIQVIGHWSIERDNADDNISGHYSLIWQQRNGKWVIISDHSS